jgi:hypothetical protein
MLGSGTDRTTADMIAVPSATYFNAVTMSISAVPFLVGSCAAVSLGQH